VTEDQWNGCTDPTKMLEFLRASGILTERKARLFAAASCRKLWTLLADDRSRNAVERAERYADRECGDEELSIVRAAAQVAEAVTRAAEKSAEAAIWNAVLAEVWRAAGAEAAAAEAAARTTSADAWEAAQATAPAAAKAAATVADEDWNTAREAELAVQADLVRDIFGPLSFRPLAIDPSWLTSAVLTLAQSIYDLRSFDRLPELASRLEAGGCTDALLLDHLRGAGLHVRGCFALDAILGKD